MIRHTPAVLALAAAIAGSAQAQNAGLEEMVVTAQKREETIQETPISIAAFSSDALAKMGVASVADIDKAVPNVLLTPFPASRTAITAFIRGVGNVDLQVTKDAAVGIYVDGVFLGRASGLASDVADLERVEVLRGPQGTLYGRNTTGGAINMVTAKPENALGFRQQLSAGNRDYVRSQTMINLPITGQLAARATYMTSHKDGWVKNAGPGPDFSEDDKEAARLALRWTPLDNLTVDYAYDTSRATGGMSVYQITSAPARTPQGQPNVFAPYAHPHRLGTLSVPSDHGGIDDHVDGHALTISWDATDALTINSISAYRELRSENYYDYSGSVEHLNRAAPPAQAVRSLLPRGAQVLDAVTGQDQWQLSQEFQAIGDALDGRLEYVAGLYYFHEQGSDFQSPQNNVVALSAAPLGAAYGALPPALRATYDLLVPAVWSSFDVNARSESLAAYSQFAYTPAILDDRLKLTLGLRFTRDEREATKVATVYDPGLRDPAATGAVLSRWRQRGETDSSRFTPSFTAAYDIADGVNLYAKYSEAYRAGGFNARADRNTFGRGFSPEEMTAYEIGLKSDLLDNRVRLNAAVFHYVYDDLQVDQNVPPNIGVTTTLNAGKAEVDGFEIDLTALLADGLTLTASYGYLDSDFKEFFDTTDCAGGSLPPGRTEEVADCRHVPASPQESYTVALDYAFPSLGFGELSARIQYHWEDSSFFTTKGPSERSSFGLLDASLQLAEVAAGAGRMRVQLWGKNLENKAYFLHGIDFNTFQLNTFNEPRSYGLDLTYEY